MIRQCRLRRFSGPLCVVVLCVTTLRVTAPVGAARLNSSVGAPQMRGAPLLSVTAARREGELRPVAILDHGGEPPLTSIAKLITLDHFKVMLPTGFRLVQSQVGGELRVYQSTAGQQVMLRDSEAPVYSAFEGSKAFVLFSGESPESLRIDAVVQHRPGDPIFIYVGTVFRRRGEQMDQGPTLFVQMITHARTEASLALVMGILASVRPR